MQWFDSSHARPEHNCWCAVLVSDCSVAHGYLMQLQLYDAELDAWYFYGSRVPQWESPAYYCVLPHPPAHTFRNRSDQYD
ncbi:hypothetical protein [Thiospirillum jenense]|uniref:Uncharacterized protein n=1 Tax=Thiospirillum jenense TaxID=1653858 RepID=A0A839HE54_9GAMM|nr:hypothetical protein [Thiospirillum jenense]MBB1125528.1 hypothetical protein [Thiospirillum jenense]